MSKKDEVIGSTDAVTVTSKGVSYGLIKRVEDSCSMPVEQMLNHLIALRNRVDETYFEIGGILRTIYDKHYYLGWGYKDWKSFVEDKLQFSLRKAQYLTQIWHYFSVQIGDEETIRKITPLGWGKAKELVGVVDPKNVDEWVKKSTSMTVSEVSRAASSALAGGKEIEKPSHMVAFKLYDEQFQNVEDAIKIAEQKSSSVIRSNNLSLICLEFMVNNPGLKVESEEEKKQVLATMMKAMEKNLGLKIIALNSENTVIYGEQYVAGE